MNVFRNRLDNALKVIVVELPHLHSIEIGLFIRSGPRFETHENLGISHFAEHMLFRGTRSIPGTFQLHAEIERLGSPICAATSRDFCQFSFAVPPRNLERACQLFAEIVIEPAFEDIELERQIVLEEYLIDQDENGEDINLENHSRLLLWPGSPLGGNILGTQANIRRFTREDLFEHHRRFYNGGNGVLYFVGAIHQDQAMALARRYFGRIPPGEIVPMEEVTRTFRGPLHKYIDHDDSQEQLYLSFLSPSLVDPDHVAMLALQNVLVDGMSSRLQWRICERMGMSYHIDAGMETYVDTGVFDVESSIGRGKLVPLLREILDVLRELRDSCVDGPELEKARERCRFANEFALDSPATLANWLVALELYQPAPTLDETLERVGALVPEDLQRVARKIFVPENMVLVVVGHSNRTERNRIFKLTGEELVR